MAKLLPIFFLLCSCSVFVDSDYESTRIGIEINHKEVEEVIFNLLTPSTDMAFDKK